MRGGRAHQRWFWSAMPISSSPVKARGGMFEDLCDDLPWSQRLGEVWRMRTPEERDMSLALAVRARQPVAQSGRLVPQPRPAAHRGPDRDGRRRHHRLHQRPRRTGKDAAILCDTWEIADAINRRLHDAYTDQAAPAVRVARDQDVRVGDLIISRHNDATLTVEPGTAASPRGPGRPGPQRQPLAGGRRRRHRRPHRRRAAHRLGAASSSRRLPA